LDDPRFGLLKRWHTGADQPAARADQRWSNFLSDTFTDGRRFSVLTVVDDFTRERPTLVPDASLSGARVALAARVDNVKCVD
jgi:hypothetical protein